MCGVVSCSALKRRYRDVLIGERADIGLVHLQGSFALISSRLERRKGHFMPPALLRSQFDALEMPGPEENAIRLSVRWPQKQVVSEIIAKFELSPVHRVLF